MSLETLPLELQIEILSQYPETSIIGQQLSKTLQPAANDACLKTVGLTPLSKKELENYLKTEPRIVGLISGNANDLIDDYLFAHVYMLQNYGLDQPEWASTSINPIREEINDHQIRIELFYCHETFSWQDTELCTLNNLCRNPSEYNYDILTIYRILKRRKGCMHIDPQYAKKRALAIFEKICAKNDGLNLIYLHLYLSMHVWIFNLDIELNVYELIYNNKTKMFEDDDEDWIYYLSEDNEILIEKIRQHLLIQD